MSLRDVALRRRPDDAGRRTAGPSPSRRWPATSPRPAGCWPIRRRRPHARSTSSSTTTSRRCAGSRSRTRSRSRSAEAGARLRPDPPDGRGRIRAVPAAPVTTAGSCCPCGDFSITIRAGRRSASSVTWVTTPTIRSSPPRTSTAPMTTWSVSSSSVPKPSSRNRLVTRDRAPAASDGTCSLRARASASEARNDSPPDSVFTLRLSSPFQVSTTRNSSSTTSRR